MTILTVVSVWDSAAETYSPPIFTPSKGVALRSFMDAVSDPKTQFAQHPEHFSLFQLGTFDQSKASFQLFDAPQLVSNAWELNKQ